MALSKKAKEYLVVSLTNKDVAEEIIEEIEKESQELFSDHSVNDAGFKKGIDGELILWCNKKHTGQVAGNYNGGGSGNKPIIGLLGLGLENQKLASCELKISEEVELRSKETVDDADQDKLGVAFNLLIDLQGNGNPADFKVLVIDKTLNNQQDKWGEIGASASVDDFDIQGFELLSGYPGSGDKSPYLKNHFYIVGGVSSYVAGTNYYTASAQSDTWTQIPMSLDVLINGGTMPLTGAQFSSGYPNAKIISTLSFDGGHGAAELMPPLSAQIGGSSNALRAVTAVKSLVINGKKFV